MRSMREDIRENEGSHIIGLEDALTNSERTLQDKDLQLRAHQESVMALKDECHSWQRAHSDGSEQFVRVRSAHSQFSQFEVSLLRVLETTVWMVAS